MKNLKKTLEETFNIKLTKRQTKENGMYTYTDGEHLAIILNKNEFWLSLWGTPRIYVFSEFEAEFELKSLIQLDELMKNRFFKGYLMIKSLEEVMN